MTADGNPKLLDFGIAKLLNPEPGRGGLTIASRRLGSPSAMAPEQILGLPVDGRTDVYAMGVLIYFLLSGQLPFGGDSPTDVERMHLETPPPRVSEVIPISRKIDEVILCCLEKRPERRFASVTELLNAFAAAVAADAPAGASQSGTGRPAVVVWVELRMKGIAEGEEIADELFSEMATALDSADQTLREAGFEIALQTSSGILAGKILDGDAARSKKVALTARETATRVHDNLLAQLQHEKRLHLNVALHIDQAVVREAGDHQAIVEGAVFEVGSWAPQEDFDGLFVTAAANNKLA